MQMVNVFKATPGMRLVRDVINKDGRHLMEAGRILGQSEIRILRMWGILEVAVSESGEPDGQVFDGPGDERLRAFLNRWFSSNPIKDPVIRSMHDLCTDWFRSNPEVLAGLLSRLAAAGASKKEKIPAGLSCDPETLLAGEVKLPALPQIYSEISAVVDDPTCSGKEIAQIVSKDTSLSASLLKIVNSAFYGLPEKVDSLHYAAMALGTQQICSLAMGITVLNYFKGMPEHFLDMAAFWRHSLGCAIAASNLATHVRGVKSDRVFIGGLLHDIGRLVFCSFFPEASRASLSRAAKLGLPLEKTEPLFFKTTHAEFGSRLAEWWHFSPEIIGLIRHHHAVPGDLPGKEAALVYLANWLTSALGIGFSGEITLSRLDIRVWNVLEIPSSALVPVVRQTDRQLTEAIRFFYE